MTLTVRAASPLEAHIADYLADNPGKVPTLVATDLIEHGWYGATAEAAEKLDAVVDAVHTGAISTREAYRRMAALADELKAEVGA